ncbi:MAG: WYL domain-containing protein [Oscillospiraceae bacterium]|nr:WYL domain-containing protein [Oscillospiraceae bacterium]
MPKSSNQKLRILYLMRILLQETDEAHLLSANELVSKLAKLDIAAERKTIYDDIEALKLFGLDIIIGRGSTYGYHVASRDFELPELKLLADAVQSSKFITEKKTLSLIKKLEGLASRHEAGKLRRQVYIQNRVKNMDESIYYSIDALNEAISAGRKISFRYFDYNLRKEKVFRRNGARYVVSPSALSWTEENYYLIAYADDREGITHYRVDRMSNVRMLDEKRSAQAAAFKLADYSKKVFGMFGGEEADVRLRVNNRIIGAVIDRFGKDIIMIADGDEHFTVTVRVALSPVFYGWLFQFGNLCQPLSPQSLKDELKRMAEELVQRVT